MKRIAAIFLTVIILFTAAIPMAVPVSAQQLMPLLMIDNTKSNSSSNPYLVTSAADLSLIAQAVSGGSDLSGVYFRQTTAISLEGTSFSGIGTAAVPFKGTYDGGSIRWFGRRFCWPDGIWR